MIIDGQKIKNDGVQKPGADVTFDEKKKVEVKANIFPVKDRGQETAVVQKKEDDVKVEATTTTNTTKKTGTSSEAIASDSTTVAQKTVKNVKLAAKEEAPKQNQTPEIQITKIDEKPKDTKPAVVENKKTITTILENNKT